MCSSRMPSLTQCTARRERPPAPVEANGGPLSVRIARGKPNSSKTRSNTGRTPSPVGAVIRQSRRNRLCASEIVSGSQRWPSAVRNQPLKSAHQTSFGAVAAKNGRLAGSARRRRRRGWLSPSRRNKSPIVLAAGQAIVGRSLSNFARSFFGPQCGWRSRKPTIASAISSARPCVGRCGARERSARPPTGSAR